MVTLEATSPAGAASAKLSCKGVWKLFGEAAGRCLAEHGGNPNEEQLAAAVAAIYRRHRAADRALAGSGETRRGWRERSRAMTSSYSQAAGRPSVGGDE